MIDRIRTETTVSFSIIIILALSCGPVGRNDPAENAADPLEFYAVHSGATDPGEHADLLRSAPDDLTGIVAAVQNVVLFIDDAEKGVPGSSRRRIHREINTRTVRTMLDRIASMDGEPMTETRAPENKFVGICTHYALLTTAILREKGIPARVRSGFETYFASKHHDHSVCEYWKDEEGRWVRVDAEIDRPFRERWGLVFDPLDLPPEAFLDGPSTWGLCREGKTDPAAYGIAGPDWMGGWDFVLGALACDIRALNRHEGLPWDDTKLVAKGFDGLDDEERALLDSAAAIIHSGDDSFTRLRELYRSEKRLR